MFKIYPNITKPYLRIQNCARINEVSCHVTEFSILHKGSFFFSNYFIHWTQFFKTVTFTLELKINLVLFRKKEHVIH